MVENYEETLAVLRAALTSDSLTFHGDTYHFDDVPIMLRPLQQPTPPMWHPGQLRARGRGSHEHRCRRPGADGGGPGRRSIGPRAKPRDGAAATSVASTTSSSHRLTRRPSRSARRSWPVFTEHLTPLFRKWDIPPPNDPTLGGDVELALQLGAIVAGSPSTVAERIAAVRGGRGHRSLRREVHDGRPDARRGDAFDRPVRQPRDAPLTSGVRGDGERAHAFFGSSENGRVVRSPGSFGSPSARSPMMLRWI